MRTLVTAWANAPYVIAAGIAVVFAFLQTTGLLGLFAGHSHHDAGGHDAHDGSHDSAHVPVLPARALTSSEARSAAVVTAPAPLPIRLQVLALSFAFVGLLLNTLWNGIAGAPPASLLLTLPVSAAFALFAVRVVSRSLAPIFTSRPAAGRAELVGKIGTVISSGIDEEFGEVRIRDDDGRDVRLVCRLASGAAPARERENVLVVDYEPTRGELLVVPLDPELSLETQCRARNARS